VTNTITYDILYLKFGGSNLKASFDVNGLEITTTAFNSLAGVNVNQITASVSGTGTDTDGTPAIVQGTINVFGGGPNAGGDGGGD
jgi:hypothetical protein